MANGDNNVLVTLLLESLSGVNELLSRVTGMEYLYYIPMLYKVKYHDTISFHFGDAKLYQHMCI